MKRQSPVVTPFYAKRTQPLQLPLRTASASKAVQISTFPEFAGVAGVGRERWCDLDEIAPGVLVGYGYDLGRLAARVAAGGLRLGTVDHAIFALTDCGSHPLSEVERVDIWQTFGVPIYELIVAPGCRLLAWECEAHDGWHLGEGIGAFLSGGELICNLPPRSNLHTGMTAYIDRAPCACGRPGLRLQDLTPYLKHPVADELLMAIA